VPVRSDPRRHVAAKSGVTSAPLLRPLPAARLDVPSTTVSDRQQDLEPLPRLRRKRRFDLPKLAAQFSEGIAEVEAQVERYHDRWDEANEVARRESGPLWVALGDSSTQGVGASTWENGWTHSVLERLSEASGEQWRIINLSMSGGRFLDVADRQVPVQGSQAVQHLELAVRRRVARPRPGTPQRHRLRPHGRTRLESAGGWHGSEQLGEPDAARDAAIQRTRGRNAAEAWLGVWSSVSEGR